MLLQIGDVLVDRRQAVRPVSPQVSTPTEGDVPHVNAFRAPGELGPGLPRGPVRLERLLASESAAGTLVESPEHSGEELGGEEAPQAALEGDVDCQPAERRRRR